MAKRRNRFSKNEALAGLLIAEATFVDKSISELSIESIAEAIGCNPRALRKMRRFREIWKSVSQAQEKLAVSNLREVPRGKYVIVSDSQGNRSSVLEFPVGDRRDEDEN